ncbi:MAG: apolipoprotein N-acyltransferase [Candidatus Omnitrophota bacterium]
MLRQLKKLFQRTKVLSSKGGVTGFIVSAVLLSLSFPAHDLEYLAWCAFLPFFLALKNTTKPKAFFFSYASGIVFWLSTIYWVAHVTAAGMLILVSYLALYFALFGLCVSFILRRGGIFCLFYIPGLWVILEYVRSHLFSGFPWALLAYSQYKHIFLIQCADIAGAWGVSFIVMLVNVSLYVLLENQLTAWKKLKLVFALCVLLSAVGVYGFKKVTTHRNPAHTTGQNIAVALIQGNIPQELKWDTRSETFILHKYFRITDEAAKEKPDLLIWPEAAVPFILGEEPGYLEYLKGYVEKLKLPLLLGAVTFRNGAYYNSALLMQPDGSVRYQYDKLHLVPFGEYVPLRRIFPFLNTIVPIGDFHSGSEYTVFGLSLGNGKAPIAFSVLICFEDLFPHLSREFVQHGAQFLVNITNDGWFQKTQAPYQHLQASVFRAVENHVYVLRAANTGITAFINPCGEVFSFVRDAGGEPTFIDGFDQKAFAPGAHSGTFYTRHGDFLIVICVGLVLLGAFKYFGKRRR